MADYSVVSAAEAGIDTARLDDLRGRVAHAIDRGPLPAVQVAVARYGRLVLFETLGAADNATRFSIFSCTKPLVAAAIWRLMGEGRLDIERPVADYLPEFGSNEKAAVTVRQVLCHTGGFPNAPLDAPDWWDSAGRRRRMAHWYLEWEPDSQLIYHPLSGHWVLAELIIELTGLDYRQYIRDTLIEPLGLAGLQLGVPVGEQGDIAWLDHVGEPPEPDEIEAQLGMRIDFPATQDDSLLIFNDPAVRALGIPGGGAVATAADVALFYQGLIANPGQIWVPEVLADATGNVYADHIDPMTGCPAHRGLGVVIAGSGRYQPYRGMGDKVSSRAFGHQGAGGQVAWGDPVTGLSFCLLTNGLDANPLRSARFCAAASNRAGACVPLS